MLINNHLLCILLVDIFATMILVLNWKSYLEVNLVFSLIINFSMIYLLLCELRLQSNLLLRLLKLLLIVGINLPWGLPCIVIGIPHHLIIPELVLSICHVASHRSWGTKIYSRTQNLCRLWLIQKRICSCKSISKYSLSTVLLSISTLP